MGFFDFFRQKEKKEQIQTPSNEIKFSDLQNWFAQVRKEESEKINFRVSGITEEFLTTKAKLLQSLAALETAQVTNPNLLDRAKQIMEGNRATYLEKIRIFAEKNMLPADPEKIKESVEVFDVNISSLDKSVAKSHTVLLEFFNEKATAVQLNLRTLDKLAKEAKKTFENSRLPEIKKLEEKFQNYIKEIEEKNQEKDLFNKAEVELNSIQFTINSKEQEIAKRKSGLEYKMLKEKISMKEQLTKQNEIVDAKIRRIFSEIEPALKKYENLSKNQLVKTYLENSVSALIQDEKLEIIQSIEAARKAMVMNQITINEKKRMRVFNEISAISKESLANLAQQKKESQENLAKISSEIKDATFLKETEELEKSLIVEKAELDRQKKSFEKAKSKSSELDFNKMKEELQQDINQKLNRVIRINF